MSWVPKSKHVSQLRYDAGSNTLTGDEDCGPACLVRYLREYGKMDPAGDRLAQLNAIREIISGLPDEPNQAGTTTTDLERVLEHYGIHGAAWTDQYEAAHAAAWSILLIDYPPSPQQYWPAWLAGQCHWVLWLPQWQGSDAWFNDPLAYNNHQADCQYDLTTVRGVFAGAILLPDLPSAAPKLAERRLTQNCALKVQASHASSALTRLAAGTLVEDMEKQVKTDDTWRQIRVVGKVGWVPALLLAAPPGS